MKEERDSCPLPNPLQGQAPTAGMTEEDGCPIETVGHDRLFPSSPPVSSRDPSEQILRRWVRIIG